MPGGAAAKGWAKIMSAGASALSALADLWDYFFGSDVANIVEKTKSNKTSQNKAGSNLIPIRIPDTNARRLDNDGIKYRVNDTAVRRQDYNTYQDIKENNTRYLDSLIHSK